MPKPGQSKTRTARSDVFNLPHTELWFCSDDLPQALLPGEGDFFHVRFRGAGAAAAAPQTTRIAMKPELHCISAQGGTLSFDGGFQQIIWRIPRPLLVKKLAILTGMPVTSELIIHPVLDLTQRSYDTLSNLMACVIGKVQAVNAQPNRLVLAELEQAMLVALLCQSEHVWRRVLDGECPAAVPWQVRRVEEYIVAHWNEPLAISEMASLTGASVRSIFRSFQQFRGYTPGEFLRQQRLRHAREMLMDPNQDYSIAAVMNACGFTGASHFGKEFAKAFGELPSAMRRRK